MKKFNLLLNMMFILAVVLSLNSCISINRDIKLNKDGSGEEVLSITFLKEFYAMMSVMTEFMDSAKKETFLDSLYNDDLFISEMQGKYDSISGVRIIDISSQSNYDSSKSFTIQYSFDSLSKIGSLMEKTVEDDTKIKTPAVVTLEKTGDEYLFTYLYENKESADIQGNDSLAEQMDASIMKMFDNGFINIKIEFPYDIISSNATLVNGNTLTWRYTFPEIIMRKEMKLEAVMK